MKNRAYWKKRFELLEQSQNQRGMECYANIEKQYRKAQRQIEGQIATWYQRFANNNSVTLQEARRMLNSRELEELKWDVKQYIRHGEENATSGEWMKQLENASARYHISRLEALKLQTQQSLEEMFGNQLDSIDSVMRGIYLDGYYQTAYEIQKGFGVGWNFSTLDNSKISKVINKPWAADGKNFSQRIWENRKKLVNELHTELTRNIILGQDPQKAIDAVARKMNTSKNATGRLVMTEEAFFSSAAQKDCFKELDVEEFEIVATLDSRTSDTCQEMDGKHFPMSQWEVGITAPPFHVWCRTTTVPYFDDDFGSVGERAARGADGKTYYIPADMTYKDWQQSFVDGEKSGLREIEANDIKGLQNSVSNSIMKSVKDTATFDELEKYFADTYSITMKESVKKLDLSRVRESLNGVERVLKEYPELSTMIQSIETSSSGVMSCNGKTITFNPSNYSQNSASLNELCNNMSNIHHWVKNATPESIGVHEAGHGVEWLIIQIDPGYMYDFERIMAWNSYIEAKSIVNQAISEVKKTSYGKGKGKAELVSAISNYANDNDSETLAEAFADVFTNGSNANPLSVEIKKITMERYNQYKGGGTS